MLPGIEVSVTEVRKQPGRDDHEGCKQKDENAYNSAQHAASLRRWPT